VSSGGGDCRLLIWGYREINIEEKNQLAKITFFFHSFKNATYLPSSINSPSRASFSSQQSSSFGGISGIPTQSIYRTPHRQRLLLFRYSRMNQRNSQRYENLLGHSSMSNPSSPANVVVRNSRSASLESPYQKRFYCRKNDQYQTMVDDNSIDDSDGSNMTTITTTTTGE
jgi:hypothetical protein